MLSISGQVCRISRVAGQYRALHWTVRTAAQKPASRKTVDDHQSQPNSAAVKAFPPKNIPPASHKATQSGNPANAPGTAARTGASSANPIVNQKRPSTPEPSSTRPLRSPPKPVQAPIVRAPAPAGHTTGATARMPSARPTTPHYLTKIPAQSAAAAPSTSRPAPSTQVKGSWQQRNQSKSTEDKAAKKESLWHSWRRISPGTRMGLGFGFMMIAVVGILVSDYLEKTMTDEKGNVPARKEVSIGVTTLDKEPPSEAK